MPNRSSTRGSSSVADPNVPEEELRRLEEELRRVKVSDVLVQTLYTVSSLGYQRLTPNERDLDQARLAIEAITALVPVLEGTVPADAIRDFSQVKANMQLAYASAVAETQRAGGSDSDPAASERGPREESDPERPAGSDAEASAGGSDPEGSDSEAAAVSDPAAGEGFDPEADGGSAQADGGSDPADNAEPKTGAEHEATSGEDEPGAG
jgi:hypothetical protein